MTGKIISLLASAAVLLSGCTMIPEYKRPEAPVPAAWPSGPAYRETSSRQDAPLAPDLQWHEFFTDQQLQAIIATALTNNRDLRVAALNVERARALYGIQRAEILPTVNAIGSGLKEHLSAGVTGTGQSRTAEQYSANLGISAWEIDFFGRIRSLTKSALEQYLATEQARRSAQTLLVSEVANVYLTLAADRESIQLARSTLESQQAAYNLIRRRFEVGVTHELDVRQAQTRVDAARVDVARFTDLAAQDENALNLLAGSPVPADLLPGTLSAIAPLPDVSPGTSSEVLLRRPEDLLKAADANIGAARAAFFPTISLTTAVGTASPDLSSLFKSGSFGWNYAGRIVMPVFDARLWSALKATKVERQIAVAQYQGVIQTAFREVADALARKGTLGDQLAAQQSLVKATAEVYRLSNARYEKGIDIYLNVLDAQRSLYSAREELIIIRLAKLANQVQLYAVLGGGADPVTSAEYNQATQGRLPVTSATVAGR